MHEVQRRDPCSNRSLQTEPNQDTHREQPDRPSQRPSPRRLARVRASMFADDQRPAEGADACPSRVRGSARSGRQPRLKRACRTLISRGPDSAKDSGPSCLSFHFGCAPALRRRKTSRCTRRGMCAAGKPDLVQRDAASDGMARARAQPKWKSFQSCSSNRQGLRSFIPGMRVQLPHTTPIKSRELSRSATKPAATIGRLRNP